jgi:hypothetical protein
MFDQQKEFNDIIIDRDSMEISEYHAIKVIFQNRASPIPVPWSAAACDTARAANPSPELSSAI